MIGILDYGIGNVGAFQRIFHSQNIKSISVNAPSDFKKISKIIIPGVGAFDGAMKALNESGLRDNLDRFALEQKRPVVGICIGMHMLGNHSEEGSLEGLGYIKGYTKILDRKSDMNILLPHMGWNDIIVEKEKIWTGIDLQQGFYFLHSYCYIPEQQEDTIGKSEYSEEFSCAVKSKSVYGFQFHPEKSLANGIQLLKNIHEYL